MDTHSGSLRTHCRPIWIWTHSTSIRGSPAFVSDPKHKSHFPLFTHPSTSFPLPLHSPPPTDTPGSSKSLPLLPSLSTLSLTTTCNQRGEVYAVQLDVALTLRVFVTAIGPPAASARPD